MRRLFALLIGATMAVPALALEPLGDRKGWGGFVNIGAAGGEIETNMLAKISDFDIDLGASKIDDFGTPGSESMVIPAFAFELAYTFDNGKTRVLLGNDFNDYLQFDRTTRFALRHDFDRLGTVQVAYLATPAIATEVFSDPYQVGIDRSSTDFELAGARLTWDRIFGSEFELKVSATERDLGEERSGEALGLSAADRALLDRNGDLLRVELGYHLRFNERHAIRPAVTYLDRDLDGEAMAQDGYIVDISYLYSSPQRMRWVTNFAYGSLEAKAENPIFGKSYDSDRIMFSSTLFFPGAFGLKKWVTNVGVIWGEDESDIDFYNMNIWLVSAALLRRF